MCDVLRGRMSSPDLSTTLTVNKTASGRAFLVAAAPQGVRAADAADEAYAQIADALRRGSLEIVQERIFGSLSVEPAVMAARREALQSRGIDPAGPLTYLQGRPPWDEGLAGVIIQAVSTAPAAGVRTLFDGDCPCGRTWRSDGLTFFILQGLRGLERAGADNSPASQARRAMQRADRLLRANGASYRNTVRTWFYLSDILAWYPEFNRARNAMYDEFDLLPRDGRAPTLPASTGIRADHPTGAACSLDLLAAAPEADKPAVQFLRNPRQQEAFRYGSAFSRCVVVHGARETLIQVSGTAAIDEAGNSLYPGDVRSQVRSTLERVAALLAPAGASLQDICAATVFVKNGADAPAARAAMADLGLERLPAVWVVADVCRDELLFEIDGEASLPCA
jgi:enamine deaminase RidA (YjgF/YER057c/UK114 family)